MDEDTIPLPVAYMLGCLLLCCLLLGLLVASMVSTRFQRTQDRRLQQAPSRTEWLRVSLSLWLRSIVDAFRRGH